MREQCSAYLSIYNDWDILPDALASIAPYVSEIVLVDGAYAWMQPYLNGIGVDPKRSDARVRLAADACGVPVRIVTGIWQHEIDKRLAGFAACRTRYVFRIDADEILRFDDAELQHFFTAGGAVAQMELPLCVAPGLVRGIGPNAPIERAPLLFDTHQVSAAAHLHLVWLVLGPEPLPPIEEALPPMHPVPIAFGLHLTGWRTPQTSLVRAAFYTLNYARQFGLPWINQLHGAALCDIATIFADFIEPAAFRATLLTSRLVVGLEPPAGAILRPRPMPPRLRDLHAAFLASLADLNHRMVSTGWSFIVGHEIAIDISTGAARQALSSASLVRFAVSAPLSVVQARLQYQLAVRPWEIVIDLPVSLERDRIQLRLPDPVASYSALRQVLILQIWCAGGAPLQQLTCLRSCPAMVAGGVP